MLNLNIRLRSQKDERISAWRSASGLENLFIHSANHFTQLQSPAIICGVVSIHRVLFGQADNRTDARGWVSVGSVRSGSKGEPPHSGQHRKSRGRVFPNNPRCPVPCPKLRFPRIIIVHEPDSPKPGFPPEKSAFITLLVQGAKKV
jgi:hypothetical protein